MYKQHYSHWGGILLHRDQKVELGSYRAADPSSIDDQFVFVYLTRWRREIQLSDENLTTFSVRTQKVQKIPAFG